jgi:hypothetical protein
MAKGGASGYRGKAAMGKLTQAGRGGTASKTINTKGAGKGMAKAGSKTGKTGSLSGFNNLQMPGC